MCWELGAGRVGRGSGSGSGSWAWCMLGLVSLSFKLVGICHQGVSIIFSFFFLYTQSIHRICGVCVDVCVGVWVCDCVCTCGNGITFNACTAHTSDNLSLV